MNPLGELIAGRIHANGPISFAEFMDISLYHPEYGYYARAAQRSGRAGDFFTSVDVGSVFGTLLANQIAEMAAILQSPVTSHQSSVTSHQSSVSSHQSPVDLVEAAAGNGRLSADILRAIRGSDRGLYDRLRLH